MAVPERDRTSSKPKMDNGDVEKDLSANSRRVGGVEDEIKDKLLVVFSIETPEETKRESSDLMHSRVPR